MARTTARIRKTSATSGIENSRVIISPATNSLVMTAPSLLLHFEAATVNADVSVLPQYLHNNRYLRAKSCVTSGGRLVHCSNLNNRQVE